jgi:hypothetical protein
VKNGSAKCTSVPDERILVRSGFAIMIYGLVQPGKINDEVELAGKSDPFLM